MDVYEASANMVAFSEFVVEAARITYGRDVQASAQVSGFSRGSFSTELIFSVAGATATIFGTISPSEIWTVVKESIEIWKHLKGTSPSEFSPQSNQHIQITNNSGSVIQVRTESLQLVFSEKGSESAQKFIRNALSADGMDCVEIRSPDGEIGKIARAESGYFVPVAPAETVTDTELTLTVVIEAPVFKDGNKWRFSDGYKSFHADIADESFLSRVNRGERFGKGDQLRATVRIQQRKTAGKLSADLTLVKVHEHMQAKEQMDFDQDR